MKIGILSDTHSYLDSSVFEHFRDVDEIWHAGDFGDVGILDQLEKHKPTKGVYGNIDDQKLRVRIPENLFFDCEGCRVLMTHIAGKPPGYNPRVRKLIQEYQPHLLICGHSHILKVEFDKINKLLFLNPGAAGKYGFHKVRTLIRFELASGKPQNMEVVELGKRSKQ